jgi:hypothetical protein
MLGNEMKRKWHDCEGSKLASDEATRKSRYSSPSSTDVRLESVSILAGVFAARLTNSLAPMRTEPDDQPESPMRTD